VLLDEQGQAVGTAPKAAVHHRDTPLHLAFSCYVFDQDGRFLLTRRAWSKPTWPGAWTNSCCGHPLPGEGLHAAVSRRLAAELGLTEARIDLIMPDFRYRTQMDNGIVENEYCPVLRAITDQNPAPAADEVGETRWLPWRCFLNEVTSGALDISPWSRLQLPRLTAAGPDPRAWATAAPDTLPPALRAGPDHWNGSVPTVSGPMPSRASGSQPD